MSDPGMAQRLLETAQVLEDLSRHYGYGRPTLVFFSAASLRSEAGLLELGDGLSVVEVEGMSKDG